jgi:phosphate transport system substrate-binding protein
MKKSERDKLKQRYGTLGIEVKCAQDGLAVYVHETNPITELTIAQIRDIYKGTITSWKEVGGPDRRIILYSRENNSGTYVYFKDNILEGADFSPAAQNMPGTASVVNAVAKDAWGIGYGGAAYGKGIRELRVKRDPDSPGYAPTEETIRSGTYPIARYLYMYLRNRPAGPIKEFVDWVLGDEGQKIVSQVGYFPIR